MSSLSIAVTRPAFGLLFIVLTCCANTRLQTIYTWTDEHGVLHFSHHPAKLSEASPLDAAGLPVINEAIATDTDNSAPPTRHAQKNPPPNNHQPQLVADCQRYRDKLDTIQRAMRRGYTEPQGNRYRQQRRKYAGLLSRHCR